MSECSSCGAPILWALTLNGKRIPLDVEPVKLPPGLFNVNADRAVTLRPAYQSHFASCPNSASHRKGER
jgi:hypothetical protein